MMGNVVPFIIVLLAIGGCVAGEHSIPDGTYVEPSGKETITVHGSEIRFNIVISDDGPDKVLDRTYGYAVLPDGRIQPKPVRSADAAFGVGRFDWYWDGKNITQKARGPAKNQRVKLFTLKP